MARGYESATVRIPHDSSEPVAVALVPKAGPQILFTGHDLSRATMTYRIRGIADPDYDDPFWMARHQVGFGFTEVGWIPIAAFPEQGVLEIESVISDGQALACQPDYVSLPLNSGDDVTIIEVRSKESGSD